MKILKQTAEYRIVKGFSLIALGQSLRKQRKSYWGWKTTAWTYPSTHDNLKSALDYLDWKENKENSFWYEEL